MFLPLSWHCCCRLCVLHALLPQLPCCCPSFHAATLAVVLLHVVACCCASFHAVALAFVVVVVGCACHCCSSCLSLLHAAALALACRMRILLKRYTDGRFLLLLSSYLSLLYSKGVTKVTTVPQRLQRKRRRSRSTACYARTTLSLVRHTARSRPPRQKA